MPVRKSGARGYILKDDGAGFYEAAGGDRTVLAIEDSRLRACVGHPSLCV
jgi:hypothetical protein